ncbi:GNAT family N-acetyltransferase [Falsiroseomonas ponticola]|uniref:GNAT family N-acetyltransferase n=1 Tax=Falsiroseomonas ponticola TaxID=2786951 RepID=UPI0019328F25|nr:GNAT family N-acetyltransferase [Roseomonas ponticola]
MTEIDIAATDALSEELSRTIRSALKKQRGEAVERGLKRMTGCFVARNAAGESVGAIQLRGALGVAEIEYLWVAETARKAGIGRRLLEAAEDGARAAGLDHVLVRTYGYQNPGFFRRHGYREQGVLPARQEAASITWLAKPMQEAAEAAPAPAEPVAAPPAPAPAPPPAPAARKPPAKPAGKQARRRRRR